MKKRLLIYSAWVEPSAVEKMEDALRSLVGSEDVDISTDRSETVSADQIQADMFFVMLPNLKELEPSKLEAIEKTCDYINKQHAVLIPIQTVIQREEGFPDSIRKLHMLSLPDQHFPDKLLQTIQSRTDVFSDLEKEAAAIESGQMSLRDCTAQQLFRYANALLHGIGIKANPEKAVRLFRSLIGNDAFRVDAIDIWGVLSLKAEDTVPLSFDLCAYLEQKLTNALDCQDYRDATHYVDYCQFLLRLTSDNCYNLHTDEALNLIKTVLLQRFQEDLSLKAGKWFLKYLWEEAVRRTRTRYYEKSIDTLLHILNVADGLWTVYGDTGVLPYLNRAILILQIYKDRRRDLFENIIVYEYTDQHIDDGTFRPPIKTVTRKEEAVHKLRQLTRDYLENGHGPGKIFERYRTGHSVSKSILCMLNDLAESSAILYGMRFAQSGNTFGLWFEDQMSDLLSKGRSEDPGENNTVCIAAFCVYETVLNLLLEPYYHSDDRNLLAIAEQWNGLYDRNKALCQSLGIDNSMPLSVLADMYERKKDYPHADEVYIQLYQLVAQRDANDVETLIKMLTDLYTLAKKRKKARMQESYKTLMNLAWDICAANSRIPSHVCDTFIKEMNESYLLFGSRSLSKNERALYQIQSPPKGEAYSRVLSAAYKELYEILKLMDEKDCQKIPPEFIVKMRTQMDIFHPFVYDETKKLNQQELLRFTRALLGGLYQMYLKDS